MAGGFLKRKILNCICKYKNVYFYCTSPPIMLQGASPCKGGKMEVSKGQGGRDLLQTLCHPCHQLDDNVLAFVYCLGGPSSDPVIVPPKED